MEPSELEALAKEFPEGLLINDRYEVVGYCGRGSYGAVLKTIDRVLDDRLTALKVLYAEHCKDEIIFARFKRELMICRNKLDHPNVVKAYEMGVIFPEMENHFIAMEFVDGETLGDRLKWLDTHTPGLSPQEAIGIIKQLLQGLAAAHNEGLIHRDIKPANIMISKAGEVKLADFGIAHMKGSDLTKTADIRFLGTVLYMSTEALMGSKEIDHRTDLYSVGIMAYEMVVGEPPFMGKTIEEVTHKQLRHKVPAFSHKRSGIPDWYEALVLKATEKEPQNRFSNAEQMLDFIGREGTPRSKSFFSWFRR